MALIGQIRKNSWLLIIFIGLGLALFIITSMFVGNQIPFLGSQTAVGNINGQEVDWRDLQSAEEAYSGGDIYSTRNYIWNFFVEDALVKDEAKELGLAVSEAEKEELFFGNNLHPKIRQFFTDPNTGQVDRSQIPQVKAALESGQINPKFLASWNQQTREAEKEQLQTRLSTLVSKAIYTPTWMVEQEFADRNQTASFNYVKIPFDNIPNGDVTVEDSDLKAYLSANKAKYYQKEQTRKVDYVVFEVEPTASDTLAIRQDLQVIADKYINTTDSDTVFVETEGGTIDPRLLSRDNIGATVLTEVLADTLFNAPVGAVVGPLVDGDQMKIAKLIDRRVLPDSATSRHILISAQTPSQFEAAQVRIDSFKQVIESGAASFDSLAIKYSQDPGSASNGGLYENITPNAFVPEFNDVIFYKGELGKLYSVRSQFGIHLIEPISRKYAEDSNGKSHVRIAVISRPIVPSDDTQAAINTIAQDFMANNRSLSTFQSDAADKGYQVETSAPLKANDFLLGTLGSGTTSRDIIRWAFKSNTSVGDVAPEVFAFQDPVEYYDAKYVVVGLKNIQEAGNADLAGVKEEIQPLVYNQKKADFIKRQISSQDLSAIASSFSTKVDTVVAANFNSSFISNLGNEPAVVGAAFNLAPNQVSAPVVGNTGVYVVKLNSKSAPGTASDIPGLRRQTSQSARTQIAGALLPAMKKEADIEDVRSKFY